MSHQTGLTGIGPQRIEYPVKPTRNPDSAPGDWYIDTACIVCNFQPPELCCFRPALTVLDRLPGVDAAYVASKTCRSTLELTSSRCGALHLINVTDQLAALNRDNQTRVLRFIPRARRSLFVE